MSCGKQKHLYKEITSENVSRFTQTQAQRACTKKEDAIES